MLVPIYIDVPKSVSNNLTASIIKAMLQDWYLKRWKYAKRRVSVEKYARFVLAFVEAFCLKKPLP